MEKKYKSLSYIRELYQAIIDFEMGFQQMYDMTFNEGVVLCALKRTPLSSGELAKELKLSASNTSKVIKSVEDKGFIERYMGQKDRRKMYFSLTESGKVKVNSLKCDESQMPAKLRDILREIEK
jgi:DNA-binding MarR family transcriptional regulator